MKRNNRAFTIVEIIIVIAVIGIIAAILVLALPKAIDEAHEKSALSDAKNTMTETHIEKDPSDAVNSNYIIIVEKSEKEYVFSCEDGKELIPYESNPFGQCDRAELANALCAMGLVQAPLGLTEVTLTEQFQNVSLFTGGKTVSPDRIDVEVNTSMELPDCGVLDVAWKAENSSVASIQDGNIYGKTVGKTHLTAISGNMRIAYDLYVGKRVDVTSFAELKAAVEDDSPSVFIHNGMDADGYNRYDVEYEQLPVTIRSDKYVKLCRDMVNDWGDPEHPEFAKYSKFYIEYNYDSDHGVDAFIINDGGKLILDSVVISLVGHDNEETGVPAGDMAGNVIINRNGGYVELLNDSSLGNDVYLPYEPVNYSFFGIPISPEYEYYDEAMESIRRKESMDIIYNFLNEDGEVLVDSSSMFSFRNGAKGIMNVKNSLKEANPELKWPCGINILLNEGTIYSLENMRVGSGSYILKKTGIMNKGTIYDMTNCNFTSTRGMTCIESSGSILSMRKCTFEPITYALMSVEKLLEVEPFQPLTERDAEEFISRPLTALRIKNDKFGICSGCDFGYYDIVFEDVSPYAVVSTGKFMYEPDHRILTDGAKCCYDKEKEMYIVK